MEKGQGEVSQKQQSTGVFNRYLNGVNLAPSNGEDLSEDITTVVRLVRRGFLSTKRKSLNSSETFITPLRRFCFFSAAFWGSVFDPPGVWRVLAIVWWDCVGVTLRVGVRFPPSSVWASWAASICRCLKEIYNRFPRLALRVVHHLQEHRKHAGELQRPGYYNSCAGSCEGGVITVIRGAVGGNGVLLKARGDSLEKQALSLTGVKLCKYINTPW